MITWKQAFTRQIPLFVAALSGIAMARISAGPGVVVGWGLLILATVLLNGIILDEQGGHK